jgi:hypothetical protein
MSLSAARHAAQQESRVRLEVAVTVAAAGTEAMGQPRGRCFPLNAPRVAKTLKYLLNPVVTDQSTVQIVTAKRTQ